MHQTPVEVVLHDTSTEEFIVCSGTGPNADWYRNLRSEPATAVQVGEPAVGADPTLPR